MRDQLGVAVGIESDERRTRDAARLQRSGKASGGRSKCFSDLVRVIGVKMNTPCGEIILSMVGRNGSAAGGATYSRNSIPGPDAARSGGAMLAGAVSPADALHAALETTPSGETIALAGARTASMVLSFRSGETWCREFTLTDGKSASRAIACREDGQWSVKLAASELASGGGYATASSGVAAAFEAGASALGADEPLDRAAEDALLGD